ncbi:MAG: class I SAM-dependent methyltransferase [Acidobacteriota bacterium]
MGDIETAVLALGSQRLPRTIADRTRRVYDRMACVYPASTFFFHARAHRRALEASGLRNGMRVLEVATGSGEMFRRLVKANCAGENIGFDLSPNMAQRTQGRIRKEFPGARTLCHAVDARHMPFRDESFDAVFCCYLLELLGAEDILKALAEIRRVLRAHGKLTLICIGEQTPVFNRLYKIAGAVAPAFWGRQVEHHIPSLLEAARLSIIGDHAVRQSGYPSRVLVARK